MRVVKASVVTLLLVLAGTVAADANAFRGGHHGGGHFRGGHHFRGGVSLGVVIGAPALWYSSPYYYRPFYGPAYYYPPVVVREAPPVYVEQAPAAAPSQGAEAYWYYCPNSQAYYPYVNQCAGPWQRVAPQPPPS